MSVYNLSHNPDGDHEIELIPGVPPRHEREPGAIYDDGLPSLFINDGNY